MGSITQSNGHCTSKINKRVQSGVPCARRIAATVKVEGLQDDSETCVSCVMFEDGGTNKKTGSGSGCSRVEGVKFFIGSGHYGHT